jgi:hypothetical protein
VRFALAVLLLTSSTLHAGALTYRFRTTVQGILPRERRGTAWLDGPRARIEIVSEAGRFATLRDPAAKDPCTNLDLERKTYYPVACDSALGTAEGPSPQFALGRRFGGNAAEAPRRSPPRVEESESGPGEEIAGFPTRHLVWAVSWSESQRIGPDTVRVEISRTLEAWTSERVVQAAFRFGHADDLAAVPEEVRSRVADRLAATGFPLKLVVRSTRKFDRGEPSTETLTTEIEDVRPATAEAALFEIPAGFRYEKPLIGIPTK